MNKNIKINNIIISQLSHGNYTIIQCNCDRHSICRWRCGIICDVNDKSDYNEKFSKKNSSLNFQIVYFGALISY